ncbi:MAG: SHOCT domain-containing protein, partial [Candidatus Jidaibacter sp.]|nr:SHOCT domain-containing protein [Candidatus Jidaibacter sp.]
MINKDIAIAHKTKIAQEKAEAKKKHEASRAKLRKFKQEIKLKKSSLSAIKSTLKDIAVDLSKHSITKPEREGIASNVSAKISELKQSIGRSSNTLASLQVEINKLKAELKTINTQPESQAKDDAIKTLEGSITLLNHKISTINNSQEDEQNTLAFLKELESRLLEEMSDAEKWLRPKPDFTIPAGIAKLKQELESFNQIQDSITQLQAQSDQARLIKRADFVSMSLMDLLDEGINATLEALQNKGNVEIITKELLLNPDSLTFDKIIEIFKALELGALASFTFFNLRKIPKTISLLSETISTELLAKGLDLNLDNIVTHSKFIDSLLLNPALFNLLNAKRFEIGQIISILEKDIGNIVDFVLSTPSTLKPTTILALLNKIFSSKENLQNILGIVTYNFTTLLDLTSTDKPLHDVLKKHDLVSKPDLIKGIAIHLLPVLEELKEHHESIMSLLTKIPYLLSATTEKDKAAATQSLIQSGISLIKENDAAMLKAILSAVSNLNISDVAELAFSAKPVQDALNKFSINKEEQQGIISILSKQEFKDLIPTLSDSPDEILSLLTEAINDAQDNSQSLIDILFAIVNPNSQDAQEKPKSLVSMLRDLFQSLEDTERNMVSAIILKVSKVLLENTKTDLINNTKLFTTEEDALTKAEEDLETSKRILIAHLESLLASGAISQEEFDRLKNQIMLATTAIGIQICIIEVRSARSASFTPVAVDIDFLNALEGIANQDNSQDLISACITLLPEILFALDKDLTKIQELLGKDYSAITAGALAISAVKVLEKIVSNTSVVNAVRGLLKTDHEQLAKLATPVVYRAITPNYEKLLKKVDHSHHSFLQCALESHFATHEHSDIEKLVEILKVRLSEEEAKKVHKRATKEFTRVGEARTAALSVIKKPEFTGVLKVADNVLAAHTDIAKKIGGMDEVLKRFVISATVEKQLKNQDLTREKRAELFNLASTNQLTHNDMSKLVDCAITLLASADIGKLEHTQDIMRLLKSDETKTLMGFAFNMKAADVDTTLKATNEALSPMFELASLFLGKTELEDLNVKLPKAIEKILDGLSDQTKSNDIIENVKPLVGWVAAILKNDQFRRVYRHNITPFIQGNEIELVKQLNTVIQKDPDLRFMKLDATKIINIMKSPDTAKNLADFLDAFSKGEIWRTSKTVMNLAFGSHDAFSMLVNVLFGLARKAFREVLMPDFLKRVFIGNQINDKLLTGEFKDLAAHMKVDDSIKFGSFRYFSNRCNFSGLDLTITSNEGLFHDKKIDGANFARCIFDNGLDLNGATITNTDLSNLKFVTNKDIILTNATMD